MKFKKVYSFILIFVFCLSTIFSSACTPPNPQEIGVQLRDRFNNGEVARCVWDMVYRDGKIYLGSGDYDLNSYPTDICAYDVNKNEFIITGSVEDEAVLKFVEIDGKLIAPGTDPREDWTMGNYYSLSEDGWTKHRVFPNAIHTFDMIKFDGKIYVANGANYGYSPLLVSNDGGTTFDYVELYKNGQPVPPLYNPEYVRCYDFFTLNNNLFAIVCFTYTDGHKFEIYRLENGAMQFYSNADTFSYNNRVSVRIVNASVEYNNKLFLSTNFLYSSIDGDVFEKIKLPKNERVSDLILENNTLYILSFLYLDEQSFETTIYSLDLKDNIFTAVKTFNYEVPPLSFVKIENSFYVGMGNKTTPHEKNGMLLKVTT